MSDDTSPITVTLKGGAGYDAPWLVIRGHNPQEVSDMLANLGSLPEAVAQTASLFSGIVSAGPIIQQPEAPAAPPQQQGAWGTITPGGFQPNQQGQQWQGGQQAPPPQQAPPQQEGPERHPEGLLCPLCNGFVVKKIVNRKTDGKQFKFWTCVNQAKRDDGHYSEFA